MVHNSIDNKKLNVRTTRKIGGGIYMPVTGWLEDGKDYVIEKRSEKRNLNDEDRVVTEIVIQSVDDTKAICQNWNETLCKDCDSFNICEIR